MKLVKEISQDKHIIISTAELLANPLLYIDRSSDPLYWYDFHKEAGLSYWQARYQIKLLVDSNIDNVNGFLNHQKDVLSILDLGDKNMIGAYLFAKVGDMNLVNGLMLQRAALNVSKLGKDAQTIIQSPKIIEIGVKYLTLIDVNGARDNTQASAFTIAIQSFLTEYARWGTLGLNYGSMEEAIMDYVESTGAYLNSGLQTYTMNPALVALYGTEVAVRNVMIAELQEVFVKGNI